MKKLLFILFLSPLISNGQAVITEIISGGNFNTGGIANSGWTKLAGSLYIVFVGISNDAGTPGTVALTGTGETWTELGSAGGALNTTVQVRVQAFRFYDAVGVGANTTTFTVTGTQTGMWFNTYRITNVLTSGSNGADAIVQVVTASDNATIHPSITMAALSARASVLTAWTNDLNPSSGAAESGWTITEDGGYATPTVGGLVMKRENTSDNTPSWAEGGGLFSNWAGIAIELKSRSRRNVIIN